MKYLIPLFVLFITQLAFAASEGGHGAGADDHAIPAKLIMYQTINVVAMLIGLFIVLKKPLQEYFKDKKATFLVAAQRAEAARKAAEEERAQIQSRLAKLESTADESIARAKAEAADMKKQMISDGEAMSKRIREEAASSAKLEVERAKTQLRETLIKEALEVTRQQLSSKITTEDHKRLQTDFIQNIQAGQK
jgi:F-type H+-transporting ATPase subunit b